MKKLLGTIIFVLMICFVPFFVGGCDSPNQPEAKNITSAQIAGNTFVVYEKGETFDLANTFVKINYTQNENASSMTVSLDENIPNLKIGVTGIPRDINGEFFPFGLGTVNVEIFVEGLFGYGETGITGSVSAEFEILVVDYLCYLDTTSIHQNYFVNEQLDTSQIVLKQVSRFGFSTFDAGIADSVAVDGFDTSSPSIKREMTIEVSGVKKTLSYSVLPSEDYAIDINLPINFIIPKSFGYNKLSSNFSAYRLDGNLMIDAITMNIGKSQAQFELSDWLDITGEYRSEVTSFAKSAVNNLDIAIVEHQLGTNKMREVIVWTGGHNVVWLCFYFSNGVDNALFDLIISTLQKV